MSHSKRQTTDGVENILFTEEYKRWLLGFEHELKAARERNGHKYKSTRQIGSVIDIKCPSDYVKAAKEHDLLYRDAKADIDYETEQAHFNELSESDDMLYSN